MNGKTCAIYIDGDNFMYKGISELFNYIKKWNMKIILKTVYDDFSEVSMLNWRDICLDYNLTSIHLWKKHSKNSVDMKMSCDIQELLYTHNYNIDVFILCTGDRDFIPIIDKIHTQEKIVIGVSTNYFGTSLMFNDQFYYLCTNHINKVVKGMDIKKNIYLNKDKLKVNEYNKNSQLFESETIDDLLNNINFEEVTFKEDEKKDYSMEAIKNYIVLFLKKENKSIFVSQIKDEVLKSYPKFIEKDYNFSGFPSYIKTLLPEVKTESKGVGMLYAYV